MKKITLALMLVTMAALSYGQGYVTVAGPGTIQNFTNTTFLTTTWAGGSNFVGGVQGPLANTTSGSSFHVALLALTGNENMNLYGDSTLTSDWGFTGFQGGNTTFTGRLSIGSDLQTTSFAPIGVSTTFLLLGWSANLGSLAIVEQELAAGGSFIPSDGMVGYVGWTLAGTGAPGAAPPALPLTIQGASGSIIPGGMTMFAVGAPEPTTLVLAGLGGLSMLFLRRCRG